MRTLLGLSAVVLLTSERADACGGCFSPPETVTAVESHRMVVSLSTERTTLWDQIRYSGDPADFVWVLPVPDGATAVVDVADPLFFEEIEAFTAPILQPPPLPGPSGCAPEPPECQNGARRLDAAAAPDAGVTIFQEATVGPYETVIIGSEDAMALRTWLTDHNYNVPAAVQPTLDYYIDNGSDFVVLRLAPEESVDAMAPVRVRYPGYMATFPLKMVTVGAQGALDLSLWVIADQRYDAVNYGTFAIRDDELVWDYAQGSSNYQQLFRAKIEANGGRGWIAEYASLLDYLPLSSFAEVEIARAGLVSPYVTRLRTSMLVDHLADDLQLGPAAVATDIQRWRQIWNGVNAPPPPSCPDYSWCEGSGGLWPGSPGWRGDGGGCALAPGRRAAGALAVIALVAAAWLCLRRRTHSRT